MSSGKHWHFPPGHPAADHRDDNGATFGGEHGHTLDATKARELWGLIGSAETVADLKKILHQLVADLYNGVR